MPSFKEKKAMPVYQSIKISGRDLGLPYPQPRMVREPYNVARLLLGFDIQFMGTYIVHGSSLQTVEYVVISLRFSSVPKDLFSQTQPGPRHAYRFGPGTRITGDCPRGLRPRQSPRRPGIGDPAHGSL